MAKSKRKRTKPSEKAQSPANAKLVLLVFGIGPLILMGIFLFSNGFFNPPGS